jgi:DNA-binding transcriptional LysR family regulator
MQTQLRDVEYFAAIAKHGQVQRAAEALGLSQPALSKSLRRLEQAMNARLLKRTPKGVELTSAGTALLARVKQLRLSLDDVTREITDLSEGRAGHLRIGVAAQLSYFVPMACAELLREAPRLTLTLRNEDNPTLLADLRSGTLDIAVTSRLARLDEGLTETGLHEEEAATIYAAANHRLAKRRQVTLADLAQERWVLPSLEQGTSRLLTQAFTNLGLSPPALAVACNHLLSRFRLVAASDLITFGSRSVAQHLARDLAIVALRIKVLSGTRRTCVTYRKDAYLPPAAFRFIEILQKVTAEMGKKNR